MTVFIFGAGSTGGTFKGTTAYAPTSAEFGDAVAKMPNWKNPYPGLAEVITHLGGLREDLGLEQIWSCIDATS